jgi:hypothetical protein
VVGRRAFDFEVVDRERVRPSREFTNREGESLCEIINGE